MASKDVGKVTSLEKENKKLQNQVAKLKREITKLNKVLRKHVSTSTKQKRNIVQLKEKCSIAIKKAKATGISNKRLDEETQSSSDDEASSSSSSSGEEEEEEEEGRGGGGRRKKKTIRVSELQGICEALNRWQRPLKRMSLMAKKLKWNRLYITHL